MKNNKTQQDKQNIICSMENEKYLGVFTKNKSRKIYLYCFAICLFSKYQKKDISKIFVVNGRAEKKYENQEGYITLYYGIISKHLLDYLTINTNVTTIKRRKRFLLFLKAFKLADKNIPLGYAIDYLLWKELIFNNNVQEIKSCGHYDRLTTQIALLLKDAKKKYTMRQHGLLPQKIELPNKIPAQCVLTFDQYEREKFQRNVILNKDCKYIIYYESSVKFKDTPKTKTRIGIIDVPIKEMRMIIDIVYKYFSDSEIVLMMHPLNKDQYPPRNNLIIENCDKEWNLDYIFSGPSTLVYDYARCGYSGKIIALDNLNCLSNIEKCYKNIFICRTIDEFEKKALELKRD